MSTFKTKNSLRTIETQIMQNLENNETRPKFTGSYKRKRVYSITSHRPKSTTINLFVINDVQMSLVSTCYPHKH